MITPDIVVIDENTIRLRIERVDLNERDGRYIITVLTGM